MKSMTSVLRAAIASCGATQYRIAKETQIDPPSLMRFARGDASLRLDRADRLADFLGFELVCREGR